MTDTLCRKTSGLKLATALIRDLFRAMLVVGWLPMIAVLGSAQTNCDLNGDGAVDIVDVGLITSWELTPTQCPPTINVVTAGVCDDATRQVVVKAALGQGCHFNSLSWTASTAAKLAGYNVYRATTPGGPYPLLLNPTPVAGTSYVDAATQSGVTYYYVVKAFDGTRESPPSNETSAAAL